MRNLLVMLFIAVAFLFPASIQAQSPVRLASVSVDLWPEYDQPGLLVIYHIQLAQDTPLATSLSLRIPADAQINAVAVIDSSQGLINAPYQSFVQGDWSTLEITINSIQLQVEYYVPLTKNGNTRQILYQWPGDMLVDTLDVNFLLPPGSSQVKMTPSPATSGSGQGGLTNYVIRIANPPLGQPTKVTIEYQRPTDELSIASLPVQAISTPGTSNSGGLTSPQVLRWALGSLGLLLIGGGVFGFFRWRKGNQKYSGTKVTSDTLETENETVYCGECGKRAQPGDIFCRTCGARLKEAESS
jgi:hypothetical protein